MVFVRKVLAPGPGTRPKEAITRRIMAEKGSEERGLPMGFGLEEFGSSS